LSVGYLGQIETLRVIPSKAAMDKISAALDLPREYLFPESLIWAMREEAFERRVAELEEQHVIRLIEARKAGLLPPVTMEDEVIEAADRELLKERIAEVLSSLTPREQKVIELRFGLKDGRSRTLEEVGKEFGVFRERIRQIEAKALRKLRHPWRSRRLKEFL